MTLDLEFNTTQKPWLQDKLSPDGFYIYSHFTSDWLSG